jgi:hypothetical protein
MRPRVVHKLSQKDRADGCARLRALVGAVLNIGDLALDELFILVIEGQPPDALARLLRRALDPLG